MLRETSGGDAPLGVARRGRLEDGLVDQAHLFHEGVLERVVAQHLLQSAGLLSAAQRADGARPEIEVQAVVGGHVLFQVSFSRRRRTVLSRSFEKCMFDTLPRGDSGKIERGRRGCARSGRARRVRALLEPRRKPPRRSFSVAHARSGRDQAPPRRGSQPHRQDKTSNHARTPRDVPRVPVPRDRPRSLRAFARAASRSLQLPRRARIGRA